MFDAGVKQTLCTLCAHREVCAYKQDFLDILKAIENVTITRDTPTWKNHIKKAIHYDFISEISIGCKYYQNWTETYRQITSEPQAPMNDIASAIGKEKK